MKGTIGLLIATMLITPLYAEEKKVESLIEDTHPESFKKENRVKPTIEELEAQKKELEEQIKNEKKEIITENIEVKKGLYIFKIGSKEMVIKQGEGNIDTTEMEVEPFIEKGKTYLPLRYVGQALASSVDYDNKTRTVKIVSTKKGTEIEININTGVAKANGKKVEIDKPINKKGRLLLPIADIGKLIGLTKGETSDGKAQEIEWDNKEKAVYILNI